MCIQRPCASSTYRQTSMCGINGVFAYAQPSNGINRDELLRTRDYMISRGPDGAGDWYSENGTIGLGHRRLSIIDLSDNGAQPMLSADGRYVISFNGEIYNFAALRSELISKGIAFRSHSDTEVLLQLYALEGSSMVQRLRGMYAFAVWDNQRNQLFLARDPYGIKPLYYATQHGVFRFASQVKALIAGGAVSTAIDPAGITSFLVWGSVSEPFTIHEDIRALPAGHTITVSREKGVEAPRPYWSLATVIANAIAGADTIPAGCQVEQIKTAFRDTVQAHLVADVPVGAFLSAGLDSTTLVGFAREVMQDVRSITFSSTEFGGSSDEESPIAAEVARHFGISHQIHHVGRTEFDNDVGHFLQAMDQPTIDGLNTWFVAKAARQAGLKVALSGMGGDELFGSYSTFSSVPEMVRRYKGLRKWPAIGNALLKLNSLKRRSGTLSRPMLDGAPRHGGDIDGAYLLQRGWIPPWKLREILRDDIAEEGLNRLNEQQLIQLDSAQPGLNDFGRIAYLEARQFMRNQLLRDADWAGMAHSLEIRVPMVDIRFTEQVVGLAASGRLGGNKTIFADVVPGGLPRSVIDRPKTGFSIPIWVWLEKSAQASAWKRNRYLRDNRVGAYSRWAYCVLSSRPEMAGSLR